jgi:hypothetical protein
LFRALCSFVTFVFQSFDIPRVFRYTVRRPENEIVTHKQAPLGGTGLPGDGPEVGAVSSGQLGPVNTIAVCNVGANGEQPICERAALHWRFCFGRPGAASDGYQPSATGHGSPAR